MALFPPTSCDDYRETSVAGVVCDVKEDDSSLGLSSPRLGDLDGVTFYLSMLPPFYAQQGLSFWKFGSEGKRGSQWISEQHTRDSP